MASHLKKQIAKYVTRKERTGPITGSDRRRADEERMPHMSEPIASPAYGSVGQSSQVPTHRYASQGSRPPTHPRSSPVHYTRYLDDVGEDAGQDGGDDDDVRGDEDYMDTDVALKRYKSGKFAPSQTQGGSSSRSKTKDSSWIIRGPCPGGPENPSVIPSFGGHIAKDLWSDLAARGTIVCYHRPRFIAELRRRELSPRVRTLIQYTGLSNLVNCSYEYLNSNLISAFVERWQPDTNTFHMPFGEITILLHDVAYLLGIRIDGNVCTLTADEGGNCPDPAAYVCCFYGAGSLSELAIPDQNGTLIYRNGGVSVDSVKLFLDAQSDDHIVQAYLVYLLGNYLFVDKSSDRIRSHVFPLVSDVDNVKSYAWGAGTLAYLYRQLGMASRSKSKGICGCLPLLEAWIYLYFPSFRPGSPAPLQPGEPGVRAWGAGVKVRPSFEVLTSYRERIDALTVHSVRWVYPTPIHVTYPTSLFSGYIRFMEIIEPYQPDRCLRQFGYIQTIPIPMPKGDYYRPASGASYKVDVGMYADHNWMGMSHHILPLANISSPAATWVEVSDDYWDWYCSVSHRFIIPAAQRQLNMYEGDLDAGSQLGLALVNTVSPIYDMHSPAEVWQYVQASRSMANNLFGRIRGDAGGGTQAGVRHSHGGRASGRGRSGRGAGRAGGRSCSDTDSDFRY